MSYQSQLNIFATKSFYSKASYLVTKHCGTTLVRYPELEESGIFDIASLTKIFATGCMLADAMENHQLKLNSPLIEFPQVLSRLQLTHPKIKDITLLQLVSHTSGLMPWVPFYAVDPKDLWNLIFSQAKNDQQRRYSDLGFILLGKVLEDFLNIKIDEWFMQKFILPLKLVRTGYRHQLKQYSNDKFVATSLGNPFETKLTDNFFRDYANIFKRTATTFRQHRLQGECNDGNAYFMNQVASHAGLYSTTDELAQIIKHWQSNDVTYLSAFKKLTSLNKQNFEYLFCASDETLSWNKNISMYGHHGFTGCSFAMDTDFTDFQIFLSNRQYFGLNTDGHYPPWKKILNALSELD